MTKQFFAHSGQPVNIGDTVEFQVSIAFRRHRSRSKVYGISKCGNYLLISCNGIRKTFRLKEGECIRVVKSVLILAELRGTNEVRILCYSGQWSDWVQVDKSGKFIVEQQEYNVSACSFV